MKKTLIKNIHLFKDGQNTALTDLVIDDKKIAVTNRQDDHYDDVVDGQCGYLIPGLIDAHTHTSQDGLATSLKFGVTTELEMMGRANSRKHTDADQLMADVRSAGMGVTAKGGHPSELQKGAGIPASVLKEMAAMTELERNAFIEAHKKAQGKNGSIETPEDARHFVDAQIKNGANYVKIMLDDGRYENAAPLPVLPREVLQAAVDEGHRQNKLVIAHALSQDFALEAVELGVDGLAHLFLEHDEKTPAILDAIAQNHVFVTPCLSLNASLTGNLPTNLLKDQRVMSKLAPEWQENLARTFGTATNMDFQASLLNVKELHNRGVAILAGTDVSQPAPNLGGLAHGASLHHELQLLTQAGLTNAEALLAATKTPADYFATDRGTIASGKRADLVLLKNDPLEDIQATLDIQQIWIAGKAVMSI
ncbi:MAG: amidohydrolase family protein [Levilactobacillus sp.]|uniref:amidohydrolase family protein n=1 Tax=Levilactobacillus sp. TaxID=2767919 RepID=UPI002583FB10|nr:amidohydrolase family protein [Levilactobacillus sp.]MCH4123760.1 amidohydrolase family protein [Levilactobacillus sp.]MCI1553858.1 amidohydrolase family protein [Levilactobacillus sp.]MCI1599639.1 amidohydrolase family protein [Levilactobacillus sp.]MCI1606249.1 amidohydrolase family protein [Levilactobacillus sp.]